MVNFRPQYLSQHSGINEWKNKEDSGFKRPRWKPRQMCGIRVLS